MATVSPCAEAVLSFPLYLLEANFLLAYYLGKPTQIDWATLSISALPMTGDWVGCHLLLIDQICRSAPLNQSFQNQDREKEKVPLVLLSSADFTHSSSSLPDLQGENVIDQASNLPLFVYVHSLMGSCDWTR